MGRTGSLTASAVFRREWVREQFVDGRGARLTSDGFRPASRTDWRVIYTRQILRIVRHSDAFLFRSGIRICGIKTSFGGVPKITMSGLLYGRWRRGRCVLFEWASDVGRQVNGLRFCSQKKWKWRSILVCHWMLNSMDGTETSSCSVVNCVPGDTKLCAGRLWCAPISRRVNHFSTLLTDLREHHEKGRTLAGSPFLSIVKPVHAANRNQLKRAASFSCSFSRNSSSSNASGLIESSSCSVRTGAAPRLPRSFPNKCSRA